ncbi:MAG: RHS repeat-associated core domain-containing protein [Planctomycetota bacterium]
MSKLLIKLFGHRDTAMPKPKLREAARCVVENLEQRKLLAAPQDDTSGGWGHGNGAPEWAGSEVSAVRYHDGAVKSSATDLWSNGLGSGLGHTRSWTNAAGYAENSSFDNGNGWVIGGSFARFDEGGTDELVLISDANESTYFDKNGTDWEPRHYNQQILEEDTTANTLTLWDPNGEVWVFNSFGASSDKGELISFTDVAGVEMTVTRTSGDVTRVERDNGATGSSKITERFDYDYSDSSNGGSGDEIDTVTWRRQRGDTGSFETIRTTAYTYYGSSESHGTEGDLKTAVVKDESGNVIDAWYYRYYTDALGAGYAGGLKFVVSPTSYERADAGISGGILAASDAALDDYADAYFEYTDVDAGAGEDWRVSEHVRQGEGCSVCTGGLGSFTFGYADSSNSPTDQREHWYTKTTLTAPDGTDTVVYANDYGQTLMRVEQPDDLTGDWMTGFEYDDDGRLEYTVYPSAISGTLSSMEATRDLLGETAQGTWTNVHDDQGLIGQTNYYGGAAVDDGTGSDTFVGHVSFGEQSSGGGLTGFGAEVRVLNGDGDSGTRISWQEYAVETATVNGTDIARAVVAKDHRESDNGVETTSYAYTWHPGTVQMLTRTTTLPTVSSGKHGSGTADTTVETFDIYGRMTSFVDEDGYEHTTVYDAGTGAATSMTYDDGGLDLTSSYVVDELGRVTQATDANGNVTHTIYDDANQEVRTYVGWNATTGASTLPISIVRHDRAGGYVESITTSDTPSTTGSAGSFVPDGGESISSVESLARSYTNLAGQVTHVDQYIDFDGLTYGTGTSLGTDGTHFERTEYGYDTRGRNSLMVDATDTITRTVFDGLGRAIETWVGTDDTGATHADPGNGGAGGNNMEQVAAYVYDGGNVGDSNLTKQTLEPGDTADDRVTEFYHDWRNRQVAVKRGVGASESSSLDVQRRIEFTQYDDQDRVLRWSDYDGDDVDVIYVDGVPTLDSADLDMRRARTVYSYDERGRLYESEQKNVDPVTGNTTTGLKTRYWYDGRSNVVKQVEPTSAALEYVYDGAGRVTTAFATDDTGSANYADAGDVTDDVVVEQWEYAYDANGNVLQQTSRARFHDAYEGFSTLEGELGGPGDAKTGSTGPVAARVSHTTHLYDAADRLISSIDFGTGGPDGAMYFEAERLAYTGLFNGEGDSAAGEGSYLWHDEGAGHDTVASDGVLGTVTLSFPADGVNDYKIFLRHDSADGSSNSFHYRLDGGAWNVEHLNSSVSGWDWEAIGSSGGTTFVLDEGVHTLELAIREDGTKLDQIVVLPTTGTTPTGIVASDDVLITSYAYDAAGRLSDVMDPRGLVTRTTYDLLGRTTATTENYSDIFDDFEGSGNLHGRDLQGTFENWASHGGTWSIVNGKAVPTSVGSVDPVVVTDIGTRDAHVSATVDTPMYGTGLVARFTDTDNMINLHYRPDYNGEEIISLGARSGGTLHNFGFVTLDDLEGAQESFDDGERLGLEVIGDTARIFLEGQMIYEVTDTVIGGLTGNGYGLYSDYIEDTQYDDFLLRPLNADQNRVTRYGYDGVGNVTQLTADFLGRGADQITKYGYATDNDGVDLDDDLYANNILTSISYPNPAGIYLAAEDGTLINETVEATDGGASGVDVGDDDGHNYVHTPNGATPNTATKTDATTGELDLAFTAEAGGDYYLWSRVYAPNTSSDSFYFSIDNHDYDTWEQVDAPSTGGWVWVRSSDSTHLRPGDHTLKVKRREAGLKHDSFILTPDATFTPSGLGDSYADDQTEYLSNNRLGQRTSWTDRNGTVHEYEYDVLGRLGSDYITTFGVGVDTAVDRLTYAFDSAGRPHTFTSRDTAGGTLMTDANIVNRVERQYNGFGQLTKEYQEHEGDVDGSTLLVEYGYAQNTSNSGYSRLSTMTYPNGREVYFNYGDPGAGIQGLADAWAVNTAISRLYGISALAVDFAVGATNPDDAGTVYESYEYLGLGTVVGRLHPQAELDLVHYRESSSDPVGDGGDQYTGLDRFGRIADHRWVDSGGSSWADADRYLYGHDRNGNRLYEENVLDTAKSELYHGGVGSTATGYDGLNRLTAFSRGTLASGKDSLTGGASREQVWDLDNLGNWANVETDGTSESRVHDSQNRLIEAGANTLTYSANGEMTTDEEGNTLTYDGWGRLVSWSDGTTTVDYELDALYRRIERDDGTDVTHDYHSALWQVLETRNDSGNPTDQYVWSPVYIDAMVLRDSDGAMDDDATDLTQHADKRHYVQHDANFNITAVAELQNRGLSNETATVVERYLYDPYGTRTVLDADGLSDVDFTHGHQGGKHDETTGTVHFRFRDLDATLGRWNRQDPLRYVDGNSVYLATGSRPTILVDPLGLDSQPNWDYGGEDPGSGDETRERAKMLQEWLKMCRLEAGGARADAGNYALRLQAQCTKHIFEANAELQQAVEDYRDAGIHDFEGRTSAVSRYQSAWKKRYYFGKWRELYAYFDWLLQELDAERFQWPFPPRRNVGVVSPRHPEDSPFNAPPPPLLPPLIFIN